MLDDLRDRGVRFPLRLDAEYAFALAVDHPPSIPHVTPTWRYQVSAYDVSH